MEKKEETFGEALERIVNTPSEPWIEELYEVFMPKQNKKPKLQLIKGDD